MTVRIGESLEGIDWAQTKADLAADDFDNGRSPGALQASFERSQHVAIAWAGDRVVGMARLLSDGVCNAYLLDVWTMSAYRRQGIGAAMVRQLMARAPGQHIGPANRRRRSVLHLARLPLPACFHVRHRRGMARQRGQPSMIPVLTRAGPAVRRRRDR